MADKEPQKDQSHDTPAGGYDTSDPDRKPTSKPLPETHATMPTEHAADKADVRAGPGDAGATYSPTPLPPNEKKNRKLDAPGRIILTIAIAVPVILLLIALF